jgi:transcriptional repressor NrdR
VHAQGYVGRVRCPACGVDDDHVVDSRAADEGRAVRRRRECHACGQRFTTYERAEPAGLLVQKRSGTLEPFDREKLRAGVDRAATDRLDAETLRRLVAQIEEEVTALGPVVGSDTVGAAVLERLRDLDAVAYMRFASVYKGFEDLADFEREAVELQRSAHTVLPLRKATAPKPPNGARR